MTVTEQSLKDYFELKEAIDCRVSDVAVFVRNNDLSQHASFVGGFDRYEIGESSVSVKFSESWAYGGYDDYWIEFPCDFLYKTESEILEVLEPKNKIILEKRDMDAKSNAREQRKNDMAKLKELKAKLKIT